MLAGILAVTVMVVVFVSNAPRPTVGQSGGQRLGGGAGGRPGAAWLPCHPAGHQRGAGARRVAGAGTRPADFLVDVYGSGEVAQMDPGTRRRWTRPPPDPREQSFRRTMQCGIRSCPAQPTGRANAAASSNETRRPTSIHVKSKWANSIPAF